MSASYTRDRKRNHSMEYSSSSSKRFRQERDNHRNYDRRERSDRFDRDNSFSRIPNHRPINKPTKSFHSSHVNNFSANTSLQKQVLSLTDTINSFQEDLKSTKEIVSRIDRDISATHLIIKNVELPIVDSKIENSSKLNREKLNEFIEELLQFMLESDYKPDQIINLPEMHIGKKYIRINLGSAIIEKIMKNLPKLQTFTSKVVKLTSKQLSLQHQTPSYRKETEIKKNGIKFSIIDLFKQLQKDGKISKVPYVKIQKNGIIVNNNPIVAYEDALAFYAKPENYSIF